MTPQTEILDEIEVDELRDRIVLFRKDGDWYAIVRRNGKSRGFMYEDRAYGLDDVEPVVAWAERVLG